MHKLILGFFCLLPVLLDAQTNTQQFEVIPTDGHMFYVRHDTLLGLKYDSVKVVGQDTTHFFHRTSWYDPSLAGPCEIRTDSPSWAGTKILLHGDRKNNYLFNRNGDTIMFPIQTILPEGNLGVSFVIYKFPNGDKLRATFIADGYDYYYNGVLERLKTMELQAEDPQGNPVAHMMNGKIIELFEHYGFKKMYNVWNFPNDTNEIQFAGMAARKIGVTGMYAKGVFDIQPGHERHYLQYYTSCGFPGCREVETQEKLFTLQRDSNANGDTLILTHQRTRLQFISDPIDGEDTVFTQDTIQEEIVWADWAFLDHHPNEWFNYETGVDGYSIGYRTDTTGPRFRKKLILDYTYDPVNHCLIPNTPGNNLPDWEFGDGLGTVYFSHDTAGFSSTEKKLVYYQRGIEKWGEPFNFQPWTGTEDVLWDDLRVYPNPARDQVRLVGLPAGLVNIELVASDGRKLRNMTTESNTHHMDLSGLPAGLYLIQLRQEDQHRILRIIKN